MVWNEIKFAGAHILIGLAKPGVIYTYRYGDFIHITLEDMAIRQISFHDSAKFLLNSDDPNRTRRIARNIRSACKGKEPTPDLVKNVAETMLALEGIT